MNGQLRILLRLRWQMVRRPGVRRGLLLLSALVPAALVGAAVSGQLAPRDLVFNVSLLAPTVYLGFAFIALVAPLVAGGGNELFPAEQLVAYPVRPATVFAASLAMAPLNLAWLAQLLVIVTTTAYISVRGPHVIGALVVTAAYVAFVTIAGQAVAWGVVGIRQSVRGRRGLWLLAGVLVLVTAAVIRSGHATDVLDASPTTRVVIAALQAAEGRYAVALVVVPVLLAGTALAAAAGRRLCAWALHRPAAGVQADARSVSRRAPRRSLLGELTAVDRASVWRSASLRRGLIVLGVFPGLVAAAAAVEWDSLVLLPALVAAGAGLLFGVNAFCLDASGAVWLASLPHRPRLAALAKVRVIAETCITAVAIAVVGGAVRAPARPTVTEAVAVLVSTLACTTSVVATSLHLSVTNPHRADLRGPRDTPAPPATMAIYSARLAVGTTMIGLALSVMAYTGVWWAPVLLGVALVCLAARRLVRALIMWDEPGIRSHVVTTVASG